MKILIAIPSLDMVCAPFCMSLAAMLQARVTDKRMRKDAEIALANQRGSQVWDSRNLLVRTAQSVSASHIFFLDSDVTFPPDTLSQLLFHHKPIVAASYVRKEPPHSLLGIPDPSRPYNPKLGPLAEMLSIPLGCALIKMEVFAKLAYPWFAYLKGDLPAQDISEDTYFSNCARSAGYVIHLDAHLTQSIGHVGIQTYRPGTLT